MDQQAGGAAEVEWTRLTAPEIQALAARPETVVILPVASVEQHGPHLATGVDLVLATGVAHRTARRLQARGIPCLVAPCLWTGLAEHHMAFGGTFTLEVESFTALLRGAARSAARHGFRRIAILNGHGGNIEAMALAATELTRELGVPVLGATYWLAAAADFAPILERQENVLHACEAETSMMLALAPDCVRMDRIEQAVPSRPFVPPPPGIKRSRAFREMTDTGVLGDPRTASREKGERLLDAAAERLAGEFGKAELWA
jgi:creatinine amidohydrolase